MATRSRSAGAAPLRLCWASFTVVCAGPPLVALVSYAIEQAFPLFECLP